MNEFIGQSTSSAGLPDWHAVIDAFRGRKGHGQYDHLLIRAAYNLAHLHAVRGAAPGRIADIDCRRRAFVLMVDAWADSHLRERPRPCPTAKPLGSALDDLAEAYVAATRLLMTAERVSDRRVHEAWERLGFLACRWSDVVAEVVDGQRPVPRSPFSGDEASGGTK